MKLKELIKMCSEALCLQLSPSYFEQEEAPDDPMVGCLVGCFEHVYEQLYRDYALALRSTVVQARCGIIETEGLQLCRVISLVDGEGNGVPFRYSDNTLRVRSDGRYNLTYARLPDKVGWSEQPVLPSHIAERVLFYGVMREYHTSEEDWATAAQWDERLKDALHTCCAKTAALHMPAGRWLL